jgi:fibronectin type 3 domain-containing protein
MGKPTPGRGGRRLLQAKARLAALLLALVFAAACGGCSHTNTVTPPGPTSHYVVVSWVASTTPGVIGYNIYRGTTSGGPYPTKLNSSPATGTTYADNTVQAGETYYYVATAIASDRATESAYSDEASATVPSSS